MLMESSDLWNERVYIKNTIIKTIYRAVLCEIMTRPNYNKGKEHFSSCYITKI